MVVQQSHTRTILHEWARCWNERDADSLESLFTADAVYYDMGLPHTSDGVGAIREFIDITLNAFPDLGLELHAATGNGEVAMAEWTMSGTHLGDAPGQPATGKAFLLPGMSISRLRDGKIYLHRDYWNLVTMNTQLGLM